jgi:uncharacterized protein (DUF885 family)
MSPAPASWSPSQPGATRALWAALLVALPGPAPGAAAPAPAAATPAAEALHALFESAWERELAADPDRATSIGDARYNDRWTSMAPAAIEQRHRQDVETLAALRRIPRAALGTADQLSYELFERQYLQRIAGHAFKPWLYDINQRGGIQTRHEIAEVLPFRTVRDYEDWNRRLAALGTLVDEHVELLTIAARERRTQPRAIMERILPQLDAQVVAKAADSPFYAPFMRFPDSISAADRARLEADGRRAIEDVVLPAYRRLRAHFTGSYLPATRATVGIADTPQGADYYRNRITFHTTDGSLTAEAIHATGLAEVARIRREMLAIKERVGFAGSLDEFFTFLRTDAQFFYRTPEELFAAYEAVSKRIDPGLVGLFGRLPRIPYGVRAIPATSAPNTTTAYYQPPALDGTRPGYYYVNLYKPEARPKWEMEVLSVHEAVPGHHLQIALSYEQAGLPRFRRNYGYTAYVEGWALYAESLGEQLGLYRDPYSQFGQLTYDMWRAVRLVVDTGIHARGWTRQQAIDYFAGNSPRAPTDIVNEIDRYIAWPGQALAYKVGQMKIRELRAAAEQALGPRFDVRAFHDALLETGPVPLDLVDATIRRWIAAQRGPATPGAGVSPGPAAAVRP